MKAADAVSHDMTWNLPNILTIFRLMAAPAIALAYLFLPHPYSDITALCLFVGASVTDWLDGYLARKLNQMSRFGAMLDPIADKAMVALALLVLVALSGLQPLIVVPAVAILFREVFVSGLREYLGNSVGTLAVTKLAKWKTTVQMVAIAVLFARGVFEHYLGMHSLGMDQALIADVLAGRVPDEMGLVWKYRGVIATSYGGVALLWLAGLLTLVTGWDYFIKALPYLHGGEGDK